MIEAILSREISNPKIPTLYVEVKVSAAGNPTEGYSYTITNLLNDEVMKRSWNDYSSMTEALKAGQKYAEYVLNDLEVMYK